MNSEFPLDSDKIRAVADRSSTLTNVQIRDEVRNRFGVEVTSSQIINAIGAYHQRLNNNPAHITYLENLTRDFIRSIGDRKLARQLVGSVPL